jgi:hypothetical protein
MERVAKLTNLLLDLRKYGNSQVIDNYDKELLSTVNCREIALAMQNILSSGVGTNELWKFWEENKKLLPNQAERLRCDLPENHIIQRILAEHEMLLCFISDLDEVNSAIQKMSYASSITNEIRRLAHITHHLVSAEQHREREEQIIFPELNRRGYCGLLKIIDEQHQQLTMRYFKLEKLVWQIDKISFDNFKDQLAELADHLVITQRLHIFIETNLIFPLSLEVIKDNRVWSKMKEVCDQIGYCGYGAL